jgi:hypothetical protein
VADDREWLDADDWERTGVFQTDRTEELDEVECRLICDDADILQGIPIIF